jgi:PST family polysaccharide transporter
VDLNQNASKSSFVRAVKWSYILNWGERAGSALFALILAAILGPKDFGIVAIAMTYLMFIQMFLDQGLVAALIQRKDLGADHLDSVFWMNLSLSAVLMGLSILLSGWWARVNHIPQAGLLISTLSLTIPIGGLTIVQQAILHRNLDFRSLALRANASVLAGGLIGLGMAFAGCGVWALAGLQLTSSLVALGLLWKLSDWRPHFRFSAKAIKELMGFSTAHFAAQLATFADTQTAGILLGLFFGPVAVGLYRLAERFSNAVLSVATSSLQTVSLPKFSQLQDQPDELRRSALFFIRMSAIVTLPALAGLAAISHPLMLALGTKWVPASSVLAILCMVGMATMFTYFTGPLLQAISNPHYMAILEWVRTALDITVLVSVALWVQHMSLERQLVGIALGRLVAGVCVVMPVYIFVLLRFGRIPLRSFFAAIVPALSASAITALTVEAVIAGKFLANLRTSSLLAIVIIAGAIAGTTTLLALDRPLRNMSASFFYGLVRGGRVSATNRVP